jgi:hypothetical protein
MMADVDDIKIAHFDDIKKRDVILLVRSDYGWRVEQWSKDGVAPSSDYDTTQEAAARSLQLLGLSEPVSPQNWPEVAQIGGDGRTLPPRQ